MDRNHIGSLHDALLDCYANRMDKQRTGNHDFIYHFTQMWGSTALGFDGQGCATMRYADTTVIRTDNTFYVYFDGDFAYSVMHPTKQFTDDLKKHGMKSVSKLTEYIDIEKSYAVDYHGNVYMSGMRKAYNGEISIIGEEEGVNE